MDKLSIEQARFNMIEQQIRPAEVLDPKVLDVITEVKRELYVPQSYQDLAFSDSEIPLGFGQYMMKPILEAKLLQALNINPTDTILEIGTGSGFVTNLLAKLGHHVTSIEINESLKVTAEASLAAQSVDNVSLICGDGSSGWADNAPYDVIAVTGSLPLHTDAFEDQLKTGGRLFVIEGSKPVMSANLITRLSENEFRCESLFETVVAPLENVELPQAFAF